MSPTAVLLGSVLVYHLRRKGDWWGWIAMKELVSLIIKLIGFCVFLWMLYCLSPKIFLIMIVFTIALSICLFGGNNSKPTEDEYYTNKYYDYYSGKDNGKDDFQERLDNGEIRTYDDIVYHNGRYYENENSEEWEDFEYQYEENHRR